MFSEAQQTGSNQENIETVVETIEANSDITPPKSKEIQIGGIPTGITENHGDVFYFWQKYNLEDAILLHIDSHADMYHNVEYAKKPLPEDYYTKLMNSNFICAGVHFGVVSSLYFYNPYKKKPLQDLGSTKARPGRKKLGTEAGVGLIKWDVSTNETEEWKHFNKGPYVEMSAIEKELASNPKQPFILDIDLDAFSHKRDESSYETKDLRKRYKEKVDKTLDQLRTMRQPDIITITRSQGSLHERKYVYSHIVDELQDYVIKKLNEIYAPPPN